MSARTRRKSSLQRSVREVAIQGAERAITAAVRMLDPLPIPEEEARILDHAMRTWVIPSPALREPKDS